MKRPIELKISLAVLACEYMVIAVIYAFAWWHRWSTGQILTLAILWRYLGFIMIRPLVLYWLWRGVNGVRTALLWLIPISFLLSLSAQLHHSATASSVADSYNTFSVVVMAIGFAALLLLYSPRVGAWFRSVSSKQPEGEVSASVE
jgi:hypothetical protein